MAKIHDLVRFTGAVLYQQGAAQPIPANSPLTLAFDTCSLDTDDFTDISSHPTRITMPKALDRAIGVFKGSVLLAGGLNPTQYVLQLYRNGSPQNVPTGAVAEIGASGGMGRSLAFVSDPFELTAGDYYELTVFARDGADAAQGAGATSFALIVLGD